jgi:4-amino-4-deoxy-L-arabinose transferase-like glycosyltransferase
VSTRGLLPVLLVLAAALRLWGMGYGLPQPYARPDEDKILGPALGIARDGDPYPRQFTYPSLPTYLDTVVVLAARAAGYLKLDGSLQDFVRALWPVRALGVAFALATVAATFALAWHAYGSRPVALGAALVVATNYLHVLYSRFVTVDTLTTLFVTLSLVFAVRAARAQERRDYVLAGLCAGLTASCKYNVGIVGLALVAAVAARPVTAAELRRRFPSLALAGLVALGAFAVTSPYCLLRNQAVMREFRNTSAILFAGSGERAIFTHLRETFPVGFGWPVFLAAGAGVLRALRLRRPGDVALLGFLLPMLASVGSVKTVFPRYLVTLVPPLAVLAAELVLAAIPASRALAAALAVGMVVPSLVSALRFDALAAQKDTRVLAAEWVEASVPRRAGAVTCKGYGAPVLEGPRITDSYCGLKRVLEGFPGHRYLITQEHPAFTLTGVRPDVLAHLAKRGTPVAQWSPFRPGSSEAPYFYSADAFFMPFSGFDAVERGGPVLKVWDLERIRRPQE